MHFYYLLAGIIALMIVCPYIRCFFKRLSLKKQIEAVCKKRAFKLIKTHPQWYFGVKNANKCDFYVETPNQVFSIKLFAVPRRRTTLVITECGEYFVRRYIAVIAYGGGVKFPIDGIARRLTKYDFRYNYEEKWEVKTPRNVLLVNPVSMEFRYQPRFGGERLLGAGEVANGMEIASLPYLICELENAI